MATNIYQLKARLDDGSIMELGLYANKKAAVDMFNYFVEESKYHLKWNAAVWVQKYKRINDCYEIVMGEYTAFWERK